MSFQIKWGGLPCTGHGRNGYYKQTGLQLFRHSSVPHPYNSHCPEQVILNGLNHRGDVASGCQLGIPVTSVPDLILALKCLIGEALPPELEKTEPLRDRARSVRVE
jgi:hypothetical protein